MQCYSTVDKFVRENLKLMNYHLLPLGGKTLHVVCIYSVLTETTVKASMLFNIDRQVTGIAKRCVLLVIFFLPIKNIFLIAKKYHEKQFNGFFF